MIRKNKKGCICEQFAYLLKSVVYPNSSDMNELGEKGGVRFLTKKKEVRHEKRTYIMFVFLLIPIVASAQQVVYEWEFNNPGSMQEWSTSWKWESGKAEKGTATWSERYGGSVKLTVSGAPGAVDFWTTLPIDLEGEDEVEMTFSTERATDPIGDLSLTVGPAKPHGHKQILTVTCREEEHLRCVSQFINQRSKVHL